MATRVKSDRKYDIDSGRYFWSYFDYTVSETATTYTLTLVAGISTEGTSAVSTESIPIELTGTGQTTKYGTVRIQTSQTGTSVTKDFVGISSFTWSWSKTHASQTKTVTFPSVEFRTFQNRVVLPTISKSFTISAKTSYTVSYNANGGTGAPTGQTKWYGEDINLQPGKPTRTGYSFKNWNTKQNGTGTSYNPSQKYTANAGLTLYAQWNPNPYTVTYNANGGSGAPVPQTKYHDIDLVLAPNVPVRTGYSFKCWNTKQDGTGTNYNPSQKYSANSALTLYAKWQALNKITVYDTDGNPHTGKLMFYDANGQLHNCEISVYDENGNRHQPT